MEGPDAGLLPFATNEFGIRVGFRVVRLVPEPDVAGVLGLVSVAALAAWVRRHRVSSPVR